MATYISFQPTDNFKTQIYTGTGATLAQTFPQTTAMQPDLTWIKCRDAGARSHVLTDSVRGVNSQISSDVNDSQTTLTDALTSFDSDGFTLGADTGGGEVNNSGDDFVSWNWKAGTTTGITGSPSITPSSYSFNATSGVSIIAYTGNGTSGATVPHGLGALPQCILIKALEASEDWTVFMASLGGSNYGANKFFVLNSTARDGVNTNRFNDTAPTTDLFSLGNGGEVNTSGNDYIAYCFRSINGFSSFGSYQGNGNADGPFVYTGFRPGWLVIKDTVSTGANWYMWDNKRSGYNAANRQLYADNSAVGSASTAMDLFSNGWKLNTSSADLNVINQRFCYMAFSEFPTVSSNDVPGVAR